MDTKELLKQLLSSEIETKVLEFKEARNQNDKKKNNKVRNIIYAMSKKDKSITKTSVF